MEKSQSIVKLTLALISAQSQFEKLERNKKGAFSTYADLDSMKNSTMPALKANGLTLNFFPHTEGGVNYMQALLAHESGEYIICRYQVCPEKPGMQGMGAAWTYLKRYMWGAICSLYDDGNDDAMEEVPVEKRKEYTEVKKEDKYLDDVTHILKAIGDDPKLKEIFLTVSGASEIAPGKIPMSNKVAEAMNKVHAEKQKGKK